MKFLIVSFALAVVAGAQYQGYREGIERQAAILRQDSQINPDGTYAYNYETDNGIAASESGAVQAAGPNGEPAIAVQGGYQYTAPDGQVIKTEYVAGPQGFVPAGAHLPVPPPIPEAILRSLAYIAAHPQREDPYYRPEGQKYYTQPAVPVYTTPRPYYQPTYQPALQYTQQPYYQGQAIRR